MAFAQTSLDTQVYWALVTSGIVPMTADLYDVDDHGVEIEKNYSVTEEGFVGFVRESDGEFMDFATLLATPGQTPGWLWLKDAALLARRAVPVGGTYTLHTVRCTAFNPATRLFSYCGGPADACQGSIVLEDHASTSSVPSSFALGGYPSDFSEEANAANVNRRGSLLATQGGLARGIPTEAILTDRQYRLYPATLRGFTSAGRRLVEFPGVFGLIEISPTERVAVLQNSRLCPPYLGQRMVNLRDDPAGTEGFLPVSRTAASSWGLLTTGSHKYPASLG